MSTSTTVQPEPEHQAEHQAEVGHDVAAPEETIEQPRAEKPSANAEAAKYRRALRDAEARECALAARVEALQRREVERLAADSMSAPADLWLAGVELGALLDEDGTLDNGKVGAAVEGVLAERPGWRKYASPAFDGGVRGSAPRSTSWAELLRRP